MGGREKMNEAKIEGESRVGGGVEIPHQLSQLHTCLLDRY